MGMDVYGREPSDDEGHYFQTNYLAWQSIAEYILDEFPELTKSCIYWFSNGGDGLGKDESEKLASAVGKAIQNGGAKRYLDQRKLEDEKTQSAVCSECYGSGKVPNAFELPSNRPDCVACRGTGTPPRISTMNYIEIEELEGFQRFLLHSGGFEIH